MRKISATYIFPGNRAPLKNGILVCSDNGEIIELTDTGGELKEEAGLEQYSGILVPGFVNTHCHPELSHLKGRIPETTFFVLCPKSNLYIENALPPVQFFQKNGLNICLGTDSLASNQQLSMLAEMITLQQYLPEITMQELVLWSTFNGARAIQAENKLGSFEPGKQPGVNLITGADLKNLKLTDKCQLKTII